MKKIIVCAAVLAAWGLLIAQTPESNIVYRQKTVIDCEGLDVEGKLKTPSISTRTLRTPKTFEILINVKKDFNKELERSTNLL